MEISIPLQPKQEEALKELSLVPVLGYGGAKGGGKSYLMRKWMLARRLKYPNTHGIIIRKTYPELYSTHIKKIFEEHPDLRNFYNESKKLLSLPNGSTLAFGYLGTTNDVYQYQGVEFDDIGLDEATQHSEEVFKTLRTSNRTVNPNIRPKMLLTFNPGGIGHGWVKRIFIDREFEPNEIPSDFGFVQAKIYDNQALLLNNPEYIRTLEALDEKKRRAYLDGDWDVFEGQFFENWRKEVHVVEPMFDLKQIPDNYEIRLTWDDGTTNPRSVHLMFQNNDGKVYTVWEYYKAGETADIAAQNIKFALQQLGIFDKVVKYGRLVYDPSMDIKNNQTGISTSTVIQKILGNITKVRANNDRIEGARRYRSYLRWTPYEEPLMQVWSTCRHLIRTIPQLIYDESNPEDIDTDGEDHAYDDTRYGLMSFTKLPTRLGMNQVETVKKYQKIVKNAYRPRGGV